VGPDDAREFVTSNHRAVLITRAANGRLQTSPVLVGVDGEGKLVMLSSHLPRTTDEVEAAMKH